MQSERPTTRHATIGVTLGLLVLALTPGSGRAFEAIDGRLQVHGFYEMQLRGISANWNEQFDMTQWYNVLNLEFELDFAPDGFLPFFDSASAYVRTEVRFDCVYYGGCGMVSPIDTYGNNSQDLPQRLSGGREKFATQGLAQERRSRDVFKAPQGRTVAGIDTTFTDSPILPSNDPATVMEMPPFSVLGNFAGLDRYEGAPPRLEQFNNFIFFGTVFDPDMGNNILKLDDPGHFVFNDLEHIEGTVINGKGGGGFGLPVTGLLPWRPKDYTGPNALLASKTNPFDDSDASPQLTAAAYNSTMYSQVSDRSEIFSQGNYAPGDMKVYQIDPATKVPLTPLTFDTASWYENKLLSVLQANGTAFFLQAAILQGFTRNAQAQSLLARGSGAKPLAPIPCVRASAPSTCVPAGTRVNATDAYAARGLYLPTRALRNSLRDGDLKDSEFREVFQRSQIERAFNHGWSQSRTYELKEAYLDLEMFDSRLWMRVGIQNIVWGKTEVFRTTDQFNPLDLSLASLPSLEEARIPLLALRAVYSLYDVGPLQDFRVELAVNLEEFQGSDIGTCGEPYALDLVCNLGLGALAHGTAGVGIAGIELPDSMWKDVKGFEGGIRIEFRHDRFSFAISDYYGYSALPYIKTLHTYDRNVDPRTGRPRIAGAQGRCRNYTDPSCLTPGPIQFTSLNPYDPTTNPYNYDNTTRLRDPRNALEAHPSNLGVYALTCAATVGVSAALAPGACAATAFSAQSGITLPGGIVAFNGAQFIGSLFAGKPEANALISLAQEFPTGMFLPLVGLNRDANDLDNDFFFPAGDDCQSPTAYFGAVPISPQDFISCGGGGDGYFARPGTASASFPGNQALGQYLTPEQEALLGCGPFHGTQCDNQGINFLNADASVLFQSFVTFDGTYERVPCQVNTSACWRTDDTNRNQPGTLGFLTGERLRPGTPRLPNQILGGPVATRYDPSRKRAIVLPGARRSTNPSYDPAVDGCTDATLFYCQARPGGSNGGFGAGTLLHPFTGQQFGSELAALSWNFMVLLAALDPGFDTTNDGKTVGRCSWVTPQLCTSVLTRFTGLAGGLTRNVAKAGGNQRFGRRTFAWQGGGEVVLAYKKRNVLGFSMDFAEDVTKSNWAFELAWIGKQPVADSDSFTNNTDVQDLNLSVGIDRPTFIRFLNPNRTFFFNTQLFFQYRVGYQDSMPSDGPFNFLFTLAAQTAYWQDRLLPTQLFVFDANSQSGASISQVTYRVSSNFSINFGVSFFFGKVSYNPMPVSGLVLGNRGGPRAYEDGTYNGLGVFRNRDEIFMRLRYTF